jgi:hypothetical protein
MRAEFPIPLITALGLLFLISPLRAQDEQWLRYHCRREARRIIGDMGWAQPDLTTEKPQGAELPEFEKSEPWFAKWSTPMAEAGHLWIALDRTYENGPYDRLFIDSNANGRLNDEEAVKAYKTEQYYTHFGPVKVVFQSEDGPLTYHLNFRLYNRNERYRRLYAYSDCWYEGAVTVAGTKKHCVLIDQNANGTFNDKSPQPHNCDRIRIGEKGTQDSRYVGNLIEVDGTLYRPEIARDGAFIKLSKAEDVKMGNVRMSPAITEFSAGGENGLFKLEPQNGIGSLPVGKYRVDKWALIKKDDKGRTWTVQASGISGAGEFEVPADREVELSIGEPIVSKLEARKSDSGYSFSQSVSGRLGERIEITRNGARPPAPKLRIKNKDGTYERSFSFEYG